MPNVHVPNDIEGFGLVAIEAASCGATVVAADLDGISDAVIDGMNGYLVPAGDASAYASIITRELAKRSQSPSAVRQYTLEHYSWTESARTYRSLARSIALNSAVRPESPTGNIHGTDQPSRRNGHTHSLTGVGDRAIYRLRRSRNGGRSPSPADPTWLKPVPASAAAGDGAAAGDDLEGLAEVVGQGVGGGDGQPSGLELGGAATAARLDELPIDQRVCASTQRADGEVGCSRSRPRFMLAYVAGSASLNSLATRS